MNEPRQISASRSRAAAAVWRMAVEQLGADVAAPECLAERLARVVDPRIVIEMTQIAGHPGPGDTQYVALDAHFDAQTRRDHGIYFTPPDLADAMAAWLDGYDGWVVDPACGDGALLCAAARRGHRVWGIEQETVSAVAAAIRLVNLKVDARVLCADGLDPQNWPEACAVLANPPYVGEKGRKHLFSAVRAAHPDLAAGLGPRADLAYFFWLRAMQRADRVVILVSEYWMWASSARAVRDAMRHERSPTHLLRLGAARFSSAPGHHSMVVIHQEGPPAGWFEVDQPTPSSVGEPVAFSITPDAVVLGEVQEFAGVQLTACCRDFQGFVSGLDRTSDGRGFLVDSAPDGLHTRPVLRASECVANRVFLEPPGHTRVVWVDGPLAQDDEDRLSRWFGTHRERLEQRRESVLGRMPWYRLHWPRQRADMTGPKLVVPRRAVEPRFCLDLSGCAVSSDCTYLVAPRDVDDAVGYLAALMLALNGPEVFEQLAQSGKRKGELFEFYADPLRRLKVQVRRGEVEAQLEADLLMAAENGVAWIDLNARLNG